MRKNKRRTNRGKTPQDVIDRAAAAVARGQSVRGAAKDFASDQMTLKRYIEIKKLQQQQGYSFPTASVLPQNGNRFSGSHKAVGRYMPWSVGLYVTIL